MSVVGGGSGGRRDNSAVNLFSTPPLTPPIPQNPKDVTCLVISIFVPYLIAFVESDLNNLGFWQYGSAIVNTIFFIDMLLEFITAVHDDEMNLIVNREIITRKYLRKWFCIDLLTCIPFMLFAGETDMVWFRRIVSISLFAKLLKPLKHEIQVSGRDHPRTPPPRRRLQFAKPSNSTQPFPHHSGRTQCTDSS